MATQPPTPGVTPGPLFIDGDTKSAIIANSVGDWAITAIGGPGAIKGSVINPNQIGVMGVSVSYYGIMGESTAGIGIYGKNGNGSGISVQYAGGVQGDSDNGWGVIGTSLTWDGVRGENNGNGAAIHGVCHSTGGKAGHFEGAVEIDGAATVNGQMLVNGDAAVTGVLTVTKDIMLTGADCAEDFDLVPGALADPGTVMVITQDGALGVSSRSYDRGVAGVVSGAGAYRPALRLDHQAEAGRDRSPIALVGKVFCKVDASAHPIRVGDLLTTSDRAGHAMRVASPADAVGAIIGKAMANLDSGTGLIPILIALQ